jgi:hypothetical protein
LAVRGLENLLHVPCVATLNGELKVFEGDPKSVAQIAEPFLLSAKRQVAVPHCLLQIPECSVRKLCHIVPFVLQIE